MPSKSANERPPGHRPPGRSSLERSSHGRPPRPPAPDLEPSSPDHVLVGRVVRPHGVRGEVKVEVLSDVPERFASGNELFLVVHRRPPQIVRIARSRLVRGGALVLFEGIDDRDAAEELRDARLEVDLAEVPPAPEGFYYHFELIGCRCHEHEAGELGEVSNVIEDGGGHLLEIDDGGRRLLVPFVDAFLDNVDIAGRRIDLRLPPGLLEICTS